MIKASSLHVNIMHSLGLLPLQRVGVMKMSEDDLIELLSSHGIEKRTEEEAEADEEFEPWDENQQQEQQQQDHQEL